MSGSLNKVVLIGNVGRDPEIRHMQDGRKIINLSIATSETWRDKVTNERQDRTEWHRVVVFNEKLCDVIERYVKKGAKLYLEGQLQTRKWVDPQGVEKYTTEVVLQRFRGEIMMLDGRGEGSSGSPEGYEPDNGGYSAPASRNNDAGFSSLQPAPGPKRYDLDDEIPF